MMSSNQKLWNQIEKNQMEYKRSATDARMKKETPHKRFAQLGMIRKMQELMGTLRFEGDLIQSPGPGKVRSNWNVFEQILSPKARYNIVDWDPKSIDLIRRETRHFMSKIRNQSWANSNISVSKSELFKYSLKQIVKHQRKVFLVDADFCVSLPSMLDNNLIPNVETLCQAQKNKNQSFFFNLTYATRCNKGKRLAAERKLGRCLTKQNGKEIYYHGYSDYGTPMATKTWHINN